MPASHPLRTWIPPLLLVSLLVALPTVPVPAWADEGFLAAYKDGKDAIDRGDWTAAAISMRQAIEGRSEEAKRLPFKGYFHDYVPHFYLGKALFELGNCDGALAAWAESERQGLITERKEYEEIQQGRRVCEQRIAQQQQRVEQAARDFISMAEEAEEEVAALAAEAEVAAFWNQGDPSLADRQAEAAQLLAQARQRLQQIGDRYDKEALEAVNLIAVEARRKFLGVQEDAQERRQQRAAAAPATPPARERSRGSQSASGQRGPATAGTSVPGPASAPPPQALVAAAEAYFAGADDEVIAGLEGGTFSSPRATAHAHLLLAAARYRLYVLGGEEDEALLDAARDSVQASRATEPELIPPARLFPPGFVALYEQASD